MNYPNILAGRRGAEATIGIQTSRTVARQHSYNLASVSNGTGLLFSVRTSSPNLPPVAVNDTASIVEDGRADIDVAANDSDPDGDPLEVVSFDQPSHGYVLNSFTSNTVLEYFPDFNYVGNDSYAYIISDGRGGTALATVFITITAGNNDRPVAINDYVSTTMGAPRTIAVMANDSDPENDPISLVSITQPASGSATINANGTVTYTPAPTFFGTASFTYTITDNIAGNATATVQVTVPNSLTITAISPSTVGFGDSTLTITGTGFAQGATLSFAGGAGRMPTVSSLTVQSATTIVANINVRSGGTPQPRHWDVTVRNPNGVSATRPDGLTVQP